MNRKQKIAKATELRAGGLTYREIAERLGVCPPTAFYWLNPDSAEKARLRSRAYRACNREAVRAYDRRYRETHKGECLQCGGEIDLQHDGGVCKSCRADVVDRRARLIERWWAEGLKMKEIAAHLGWTTNHLADEMDSLRAKGYSLPYRYRTGVKRATKFPEQVRT